VREAAVLAYWPPPAGVQQREHPGVAAPVIPRVDTEPGEYASEIAETLHHADVLVTDSTALVFEAAARARPVVALLLPDHTDEGLSRLGDAVGGASSWLRLVRSGEQFTGEVCRVLNTGLDRVQQAAALNVVRPHGREMSPGFLLWSRLIQQIIERCATRPVTPPASAWASRMLASIARVAAWRAAGLPARRERDEAASILIASPSAQALRLHQPILRRLAEQGNRVEVVFTSRSEALADAYDEIKIDVPTVMSVGTIQQPDGMWAGIGHGLHALSSYLSLAAGVRHKAQRALTRFASTVLMPGVRPIAALARRSPRTMVVVRRLIAWLGGVVPSSRQARDLLLQRRPDAVLMLPDNDVVVALDSAGPRADLAAAAASLGIPVLSIAAGPDGLLDGTMLYAGARHVFVADAAQASSLAGVIDPARVTVIGAAYAEHDVDEPPIIGADEFRARLGLPQDRPFALFVGTSGLLADLARDVELLKRWIESLRRSDDQRLRELPLLVRPPRHAPRWRRLDLSGLGPAVVCPRRYERSGELDTTLLHESVRYAAVVVGIDGLALAAAASLGRPGIAVMRADGSPVDAGDLPMRDLWTTAGSSIRYAATLDELNARMRECLNAVATESATASPVTTTAVRPPGAARPSDIVVTHVESAARGSTRRGRPRLAIASWPMRGALLLTSAAVWAVGRVRAR
jgi:hypothetical protein